MLRLVPRAGIAGETTVGEALPPPMQPLARSASTATGSSESFMVPWTRYRSGRLRYREDRVEARTAPSDPAGLAHALAEAGFLSAEQEAAELLAAAAGDPVRLDALVERRLTGEPLAWITGHVLFCGLELAVDPGVYVPRPHTELLAGAAVARLATDGVAIDLCTGCGAVAAVLAAERPAATIVATDMDERAVACARRNGVDARQGRLFDPVPGQLEGGVDLVVGVVPYVPTRELALLQRDTFAFET